MSLRVEVLHNYHGDKTKQVDTDTEEGRQEAAIFLNRLMKQGASVFLQRGKKAYKVTGYDPAKDLLSVRIGMKTRMDLSGSRFGRWTVVKLACIKRHKSYWLCHCSCGTQRVVSSGHLRNGASRSCGCISIEKRTKHGKCATPEYQVWKNIHARCLRPQDPGYKRYGGRGIRICKKWQKSFAAFYADMGPRPSTLHSIDRIDNNGHYQPGNCKWSTRKEQQNNMRTNRKYMGHI